MARLVQKAEIICQRPTTTSSTYTPTNLSYGAIKIYKNSFDSLTGIYFEPVFGITYSGIPDGGGTGYCQLYNNTAAAAVSGSEVSGTTASTAYFRSRSSNLINNLSDGDVVYPQHKGAANISNQLRGAKIIYEQQGIITKTVTYIQIGDNYLNSGAFQTEVTKPKRWVHTAGNYDGTVSYSFDATGSSFGGAAATFRLRDITAGAQRATVNTTSTTDVFLSDASPTALTDGNELSTTAQTATPFTDGAQVRNAFFVIYQSGASALTKLQTSIQVWQSEVTTTSTTYAQGNFEEADYDPADYISCTVDIKHQASIKISNVLGTCSANVEDDGSAISGSDVTTSATTYTRATSASLTAPTSLSDLDFDIKTDNAIYTASVCSSRIVITLTAFVYPRIQINIGDVWKTVNEVWINIGDVWENSAGYQINIGDVWKNIYA